MSITIGAVAKTTSFTQAIKVDGKHAVMLSGHIDSQGNCRINENIILEDVYRENRCQIIAARMAFEDEVWAAADEVEATEDEESTEDVEVIVPAKEDDEEVLI